jgi:hypothetical protein
MSDYNPGEPDPAVLRQYAADEEWAELVGLLTRSPLLGWSMPELRALIQIQHDLLVKLQRRLASFSAHGRIVAAQRAVALRHHAHPCR